MYFLFDVTFATFYISLCLYVNAFFKEYDNILGKVNNAVGQDRLNLLKEGNDLHGSALRFLFVRFWVFRLFQEN